MRSKNLMLSFGIMFLLVLSILPSGIVTAGTPTPEQVNDYSLEVASFVKEKCHGSCENVVILGDDYVIPSFRRDISMYSGILFWKELKVTRILTDQLYTQKKEKTLSEIEDLFKKKQDVKIIISPSLKAKLHGKVEELISTIRNKYPTCSVFEVDEDILACNSFSELDDSTLIIIGGEENNALRCLPFVPKYESYLSIEKNVWDNNNYAIILNPTEQIYDNLLALINIIQNGPDHGWTFKDTVIACLWDGKFGGKVPLAKEITCNMIPLVELAPDIRDSWKCLFANKNQETDEGVINYFICGIVHFATAYDLATWGAAIFTAGATGTGGEVFDGGIAILKVFLKESLPNIVKIVGRKVVKDAAETIVAAPLLLANVVKLIVRSPKLIVQMIEGGIHILKYGPEIAENSFKIVSQVSFDLSKDSLKGAGEIENLRKSRKWIVFDSEIFNGLNAKKVYEYFGDDTFVKNLEVSRKGFEEEFKGIRITFKELEDASEYGHYDCALKEIQLNINFVETAEGRLKEYTIIHEHGHALKDGIIFSESFISRLNRLGITGEAEKTYLRKFIEMDDNFRMHNTLDPDKAIEFKASIKKYLYGSNLQNEVEKEVAAGHAKIDILARELAETEKFGFIEENKIILDEINKKMSSDLKNKIFALKDVMVRNAGIVSDSSRYDQALTNVLKTAKEVLN